MLLHRNAAVFDVLDELADLASISAVQLQGDAGPNTRQSGGEWLRASGERARQLIHVMNERLAHAFQPPIDAEDIHHLAKDLGGIVDAIEELAHRLHLHHAMPVSGEVASELQSLSQAVQAIDRAVHQLRSSRRTRDLSPVVAEIRQLKEAGDEYRDTAISRLYDGTADPLSVIRETELHELIEAALRLCKDIANVLERIAIKSA